MDITLFLQQFLNGLSIGARMPFCFRVHTNFFHIGHQFCSWCHLYSWRLFYLCAYGGAFGFSGLLANAALPVQLPFTLVDFGKYLLD